MHIVEMRLISCGGMHGRADDSWVLSRTLRWWFGCRVLLASTQFALVGVVLWVGEPTVWHCMLRPVMMVLPNIGVTGSLFVKVFRKRLKRAMPVVEMHA